ncbi:MAG TPA: hypothetical protein VFV34_18680 [Blastocatellia bacterium]|nr:hypothetical protein [Blastocatellia bacterium]
MQLSSRSLLFITFLFLFLCTLAGCSEAKIGEGVVITPTLKIRSSTAMVALDLAEVKRGERLEILEQAEVRTPTEVQEWYRVRTKGKEAVVGWVDAREVINQDVVDKTEELFKKAQDVPSQGTGRLKVRTRLRIEPGGDVVTLLSRGTMVDIVGKARAAFRPEKEQGVDSGEEQSEEPESRIVIWYQVRILDAEVLRAGWVGAQQVELDVPEEILHLEGEGRRFTGWVVFDQVRAKDGKLRNNYIGLMKRIDSSVPVDFTRLWVLVYVPADGRYYGAFIKDDLRGMLPITLGTSAARKTFTIHELNDKGQSTPAEYEITRLDAGRVRVTRLTPNLEVKKTRGSK